MSIPTPEEAAQLPAHPRLEQFVSAMRSTPTPAGVSYWLIHERYRTPAKQAEALAQGTSNAAYGQSAHSKWGGPDEGWAGAAVDVYPITPAGEVSANAEHYQPIAVTAEAFGLENLGALYGWDWAHVQIPDWRDYPTLPVPDGRSERTGSGVAQLAKLIVLGILARRVIS